MDGVVAFACVLVLTLVILLVACKTAGEDCGCGCGGTAKRRLRQRLRQGGRKDRWYSPSQTAEEARRAWYGSAFGELRATGKLWQPPDNV